MAVFTTLRCIGGHIERPFNDDGDKDHKIFNFVCIIDADKYTSLDLSTSITSASAASVAGLDQYPTGVWPLAGDGTCYFVGDSTPATFRGPIVRFVRSFATVPSTRTRGNGSYSYTWPAFRDWSDAQDVLTNAQVFDADPPELPPENIIREQLTAESPSTITYTYTYATSISGVSTDEIWVPRWEDSAQVYDFRDQPTDNFLVDDAAGGIPYGTGITVATYKSSYIDSTYVIVASRIKNYKGNIWVRETVKALCQ